MIEPTPDDFSLASRIWEPAEGFDWAALEDPVGVVREELEATGIKFSHQQAVRVLAWLRERGESHEALHAQVVERSFLWIGGADTRRKDLRLIRRPDRASDTEPIAERRFGLRAAVAARQLTPHSHAGSFSVRAMAAIFRCSKSEVARLTADFRRALGLYPLTLEPDEESEGLS